MQTSIDQELARHPREILTRTPTPLDELPHLTGRLGPRIYLKRDDLTDLALGGDKPRKLEYELAFARRKGATVLVTCGSAQSNHARLTAAAARKLGLGCAVVLSRDRYLTSQGNLLAVRLMGARIHIVDADDHWQLEDHVRELCDTLQSEGHRPYYIPVSGTTVRSCLGYVRAGLELADQLAERDLEPDALYAPFGTGGIFTAMMLALRERGLRCPLIGISVNRPEEWCRCQMDVWWGALCELLRRDPPPDRGTFSIDDASVGLGYGDPTEAALDAILLLAETEGILLDPVYSGKTFSGFLRHLEEGRWRPGQRIVLLHSGGAPALFAYHEEIARHLEKRGRRFDPAARK